MSRYKISYFKIFIIFGVLTLMGVSIIPFLNIKLNPQKASNYIYINFQYPNASPKSIENKITSRLEGIAASINGIEEINSKTSKSTGVITLKINKNQDLKRFKLKLNSAIRESWNNFPDGMQYPIINFHNPRKKENTLISFQLTSKADMAFIKSWIKNSLSPELLKIKGAQKITFDGIYNEEIHFNINQNKANRLNISFDEIKQCILDFQTSTDINPLTVKSNNTKYQFVLRIYSQYNNAKDLLKIPIKQIGEKIIFLSDVADISIIKTKNNNHYRVNGEECVFIRITANENENNLKIASRFRQFFVDFKNKIPKNINISIASDSTRFIKDELAKIGFRILLTLLLLLATIWFAYKDKLYILFIIITFIANIAIACTLYYFLNIEIHFFAMAGITLSFGMMIDNSIIVIDYIKTKNNIKIILPLFAATLTTIGALFIINIIPIQKEDFWFDFTMVIIINLSVSLFSSLILIPALIKKIGLNSGKKTVFTNKKRRAVYFSSIYAKYVKWANKNKVLIITIFIFLFGIPFFALPEKINNNITGSTYYNKIFQNENFKTNIRPLIEKILGGTLKPFIEHTLNDYSTRIPHKKTILISAQSQPEYKFEHLDSLFLKLEINLKRFEVIKQTEVYISPDKTGRLSIEFKKKINESETYIIYDYIIDYLRNFGGGANWNISYDELHANISHKFSSNKIWGFYLYGYDYEKLMKIAQDIKQNMYKNPRVKHIAIMPENTLFGNSLTTSTIFNFNKNLYHNKSQILNDINQLNKSAKLKNIKYKNSYAALFANNNLKNAYFDFFNQTLPTINKKLSSLGKVIEIDDPQKIIRHNQQYQLFIEYDYLSSATVSSNYEKMQIANLNRTLPPGFSSESRWNRDKASSSWLLPIALIIICIFFITSILFESIHQAIYVVCIIPFSYIGVFITFWIFDIDFDQGGYASFLILGGTTVNASIYIINVMNDNLKNPFRNYIKAWNTMFVPIMLTTISTILGFIPFVIGQANEVFWKAFASGTIGGLIFSIPVIFLLLPLSIRKQKKQAL